MTRLLDSCIMRAVGIGVMGLIGYADRGSPDEVAVLHNLNEVSTLYGRGDLIDAARVAFSQGVESVHALRVLEETSESWSNALDIFKRWILQRSKCIAIPNTIAITRCGVGREYDVIYDFDRMLSGLSYEYMPCLGFVPLHRAEHPDNIKEICSHCNNMMLTIVANPWLTDGTNGAVALAAREASIPLGKKTSNPDNAITTSADLVTTYIPHVIRRESDLRTVDKLTSYGADVLVDASAWMPGVGRHIVSYKETICYSPPRPRSFVRITCALVRTISMIENNRAQTPPFRPE